ncbi:hypothetical protein L2E82_50324 [Cichorium intybus]|nr:hypothetical protein L2E82_50324 [Cichorium intybus]
MHLVSTLQDLMLTPGEVSWLFRAKDSVRDVATEWKANCIATIMNFDESPTSATLYPSFQENRNKRGMWIDESGKKTNLSSLLDVFLDLIILT